MTVVTQLAFLDDLATAVTNILGLGIVAGVFAGAVALAYRWYARERIQGGLPVLVGLSAVAVLLNTTTALGGAIDGEAGTFSTSVALFNITAFLLASATATAGARAGDRVGTDLFAATGADVIEGEVSRVVEAVGRVISVELPDEIDDIVGYDPVPEETKSHLAGRAFLFPRRLTVADLEDRLRTRLKNDFDVGHVDIEIEPDGTVSYLALGQRAAGIGPTLPPETAAVAVRADPAFAASAGDVVQVWTTDPTKRVTTAEIRGVADDVVTLAVDAADTPKLDAETEYRLVTLPVESRPDREFASLLRAADETMSIVEVETGSLLAGQPVGSLEVAVIAIRPASGGVEAIPHRTRTFQPGDSVYAIARPDALRKVEAAATAPGDPEPASIEVEEPGGSE